MNKNNLKKGLKKVSIYAGSALLVTSLIAGAGFIVHDNFDHTKEICPLVSILSTQVNLPSGDIEGFTYGVMHQMKEIQEEYRKKGIKVVPYYDSTYQDFEDKTIMIDATRYIEDDGTVHYSLPTGYTLESIDGKYYGVKVEKRYGEEEPVIITKFLDENNKYTGESRVLKLKEEK